MQTKRMQASKVLGQKKVEVDKTFEISIIMTILYILCCGK
jgi:hypothetical protein